jgi:hypothetical protein
MQVTSINSILGWVSESKLETEKRTIYQYDEGNNVTVVERRYIDCQMYTDRGVLATHDVRGRTVDVQA